MEEEGARQQLQRARELYDRFTETFLACAGDTFQAGLVRINSREDPRASNLHLAARAGIQDGQQVLDAGCGICGPSIHIAEQFPNLHIDAVTVSPVQVRLARDRVAEAGLGERITVHEADYHVLPFEPGVFDVVLFLECTGYSYDLKRLYREVHRVLAPGGTVYIKDVFRKGSLLSEEEWSEQREFDRLWALHESPTMADTLKALLAAGFDEPRSRVFDDMSGYYYIGAMFGGEGLGSLELNAFGRHFFRAMKHLPSYFGEVIARKPA